jgi:septum site-determining protein MinC
MPVLVLATNDLTVITEQLLSKIKQAPEFFKNSPLIIDLQEITSQKLELDLPSLIAAVKQQMLVPIGIRGGTEDNNKSALSLGMTLFSVHNAGASVSTPKQQKITPEKNDETDESTATKLITHPIRSGQRIYTRGDLIILAAVSAGAEVMAEGNIHIYGTLRGRVLAGVQGNTSSRIFCSNLQAELVSIAGHYQVSEDLDTSMRNQAVQIYLKEQALIITAI